MDEKPRPVTYCKHPDTLSYDEACLSIYTHNYPHPVKLYYQYEECHQCDFLEWRIPQDSNTSLVFKTIDQILFRVNGPNNASCSQNYSFGQHGFYGWNITDKGCSSIYMLKPPDNPYYPLYSFIGLLFSFVFINFILQITYKSQWLRRLTRYSSTTATTEDGQDTPTGDSAPLVPSELVPAVRQLQQTRVNSLDTFRGITIALMIFVNYGGGKYWFFEHSSWNGLTVADVIFPWFAWIMGVGIALSVRSKLRSGSKRFSIIYSVHIRAVYLVGFGLFFSNLYHNNLVTFRLPGVLQRLGFSYLVVAFLESILMKRQPNFQNLSNEELLNVLSDIFGNLSDFDDDSEIDIKDIRSTISSGSNLEVTGTNPSLEETIAMFDNYGRWVILQDVLDSWAQWITVIIIVGLHTFLTFRLNVPGCPKGYLGPGGLHDHSNYSNCTGGAAGYIDRHIFGDRHIYQHPSSARVYHSDMPFDPEGLLGVLTTILTVYLGVAAGRIILCSNSTQGRVKRWAVYAIFTGLMAGFLCNWSKEDGFIPINKNLWSLSFVFITASLAFCMLIVLYLFVDHYKIWSGDPFSQAGMNSILLYIGHGLTKGCYPFSYTPIDQRTHTDYFLQNMLGSVIWLAIAYKLHKKNIFITV